MHPLIHRFTSLDAGAEVSVSWLYVGENDLFDIYLRQDGKRLSDNLCADEADGSCKITNPAASATVTLPVEIENSADYRLLVSFAFSSFFYLFTWLFLTGCL